MRLIQTGTRTGPRVIALGTFDGVHRGHRELLTRARKLADSLGAELRACTFDRHPLEILRPEAAPGLLQTAAEQAERMAECGVDEVRVIPFTRETAETEPEDFLRALEEECEVRGLAAGWNYSFGSGGRGNPELLRRDGAEHGYQVLIVPPVRTEAGEIISSSAIREHLKRGNLEAANEMLGYAYEISGPVVGGKHEGSRLGFPTANIQTSSRKLLPAFGVYLCRMESGGKSWNAIANIGNQPTLPSGRTTVEVFIPDQRVDLYGQEARIGLLEFLRPERRFPSREALQAQISRDLARAAEFWEKQPENLSEPRK